MLEQVIVFAFSMLVLSVGSCSTLLRQSAPWLATGVNGKETLRSLGEGGSMASESSATPPRLRVVGMPCPAAAGPQGGFTENMTSATAGTVAHKPEDRESLKDVGARYGFPLPSELDNKITLKSEYTTMVFETNSRKLVFNGLLIWMNAPLIKEHDQWSVTKADVTKIIEPLLKSDEVLVSAGFSTVVIDPGHGGRDIGAIGGQKVYEKKVVLDIARRVRKKLETTGVAVKLTRTKDSTVGLSARTARAREWDADIFVSIHLNSAHNCDAAGLETYVLPAAGFSSTAGKNDKRTSLGNKFDKANTLLAYYVHKEILARTESADRGIRHARFEVLQNAPCPAILVECGFVSNESEEEKLIQKRYRDTVAEGIAQGISAYINKAKSAKVR